MTRHIKPLYVRAHLNGRPVSKVMIDNGSSINIMPLRMLRALERNISDMIETEVIVSAFTGEVFKTLGIIPIDITIGSKNELFAFFMIDSAANYNILLRKDWIHASRCVPSSLHQFLLFWKGNDVEVVWVDKQPLWLLQVLRRLDNLIRNSVRSSSLGEGKMGSQGKHTWTQRALWKSKRRWLNS